MFSLSVLFLMEQGVKLWRISGDVKNKRKTRTYEVEENDDNTFI